MDYVQLGTTGVQVSRLCFGCMSYGAPGWKVHPWVLGEEASKPFLHAALDAGINFFDTADYYSAGVSEEILGNVLLPARPREELVIASKVGMFMNDEPNGRGLSRKHIMESIDATLKRLKTDYIDLYYIHRLDGITPMEEHLDAFNDVVRAGKVLYLGCSSVWTREFVQMREMQKRNGWARFVAMQNFYNLCYREEEREMIPYCQQEGVALVPWSPMARGFLAGNRPKDGKATARGETDSTGRNYLGTKQDYAILAQVEKVAARLGVKPAQVALAWTLAKGITAPIIGATKPHHLSDALGALEIELDAKTIAALERAYKPRPVMGHK
ncbi:MAG: aldo/keto reductase [Rhizobiales bacterium]|nr:aldo/keto reductase [Hyphomicrobiales bacterium]